MGRGVLKKTKYFTQRNVSCFLVVDLNSTYTDCT